MERLRPILLPVLAVLLAAGVTIPSERVAAQGEPLRYLFGEPGTLDPAFIADAGDVQLLLQLYAGLTRLDETGEAYPSLAEGWSVSDDGLTYTFRLREDLRFSDGGPLDATDVRRSWLRLLDPATGSSAPDVLSVVVGASERLAGDADEDEVAIEAPDERTLVVGLRHPAAYFPSITATPATFVVPRDADEGESWQSANDFVGSGPYVVDGLRGADVVLRANEEYVTGPPPIHEIVLITDIENDSVSAFAADEVDLAPISSFDAGWIAYDRDLGPSLYRADALSVEYFGFDTTRPPFDDARVRRAFALAVDRERLVELSQGTSAVPATSLVPPALWPNESFDAGLEPDPDAARRLLDEAGYEDRSELGTIVVNDSALYVLAAVADWEEELGVDIAVETMDFGDYLPRLEEEPPHVFTINWIADYPSPHALYTLLLEPGAQSNYGSWVDERFVELLEAAARAEDEDARAEAYAAVDAYVDEEAPVLPWAYGDTWWLVRDGLRGLGNLTTGLLDLGRVSWDG